MSWRVRAALLVLCLVLTRFFALLLFLLALETAAFLHAHQDLIALRGDPADLAAEGEASVRAHAEAALSRRRLTRHHLQTLAAAAARAGVVDVEIRALERLRGEHPADTTVPLRLADAYRRAGRFDDAIALYRALIAEVQQ